MTKEAMGEKEFDSSDEIRKERAAGLREALGALVIGAAGVGAAKIGLLPEGGGIEGGIVLASFVFAARGAMKAVFAG